MEGYETVKKDFQKTDYQRYILTGDVGGSHAYIGVAGVRNRRCFDIIFKKKYITGEIRSFRDVINEILHLAKADFGIEVGIACLGIAGPVDRKRACIKLTNVDLEIREDDLLPGTMLNRIILLNDFEALGFGIDLLDIEKDTIRLNHVDKDLTSRDMPTSPIAVIGAGSGLGMSIAYYDKVKHLHVPMPSEGGHIDLVAHDSQELDFYSYLKKSSMTKTTHPEMERVLCGKGLLNLFDFYAQGTDSEIVKRIMSMEGEEKLCEIEAYYGQDETCTKVLDKLFSYYARAARYLCFMSSPYAGLFITGTIALKNIERLKSPEFMKEFEMHDKRSDVLRRIPVFVVTNKDTGLLGCANVAVNFYNL